MSSHFVHPKWRCFETFWWSKVDHETTFRFLSLNLPFSFKMLIKIYRSVPLFAEFGYFLRIFWTIPWKLEEFFVRISAWNLTRGWFGAIQPLSASPHGAFSKQPNASKILPLLIRTFWNCKIIIKIIFRVKFLFTSQKWIFASEFAFCVEKYFI